MLNLWFKVTQLEAELGPDSSPLPPSSAQLPPQPRNPTPGSSLQKAQGLLW